MNSNSTEQHDNDNDDGNDYDDDDYDCCCCLAVFSAASATTATAISAVMLESATISYLAKKSETNHKVKLMQSGRHSGCCCWRSSWCLSWICFSWCWSFPCETLSWTTIFPVHKRPNVSRHPFTSPNHLSPLAFLPSFDRLISSLQYPLYFPIPQTHEHHLD